MCVLRTKYLYLVTGAMLSFYCFQLLKPNSQKMYAVSLYHSLLRMQKCNESLAPISIQCLK